MAEILYIIGSALGNCIYLGNDYYIGKDRHACFKCKCGEEFKASIKKVKSFHTRSCGCIHKEQLILRNTKHGLRSKKEYSLWLNMKQRCSNPKFPNYENWGGRGISVCEEWKNSFETFYKDMGEKPPHCRGLDRIENDKGYYKGNCRWATQLEQCNNTRRNIVIEFNGQKKSVSSWASELNLNYRMVIYYYKKGVKPVSEIFNITKIAI